MLIRVRGYNDGIKEYLEKGQKKDREFERDVMDERVILYGDLEITNEIIQSIDSDAERYLNVTLSFKEDEVPRDLLGKIVRDFEAFAYSAYSLDEYNFYAEAHVPRLKSYADRKSGEPIERKVHIHIVMPKLNLLTGRRTDPLGLVSDQTRFLEAFQEHTNHRYGLASPKDNRRSSFNDASEMISRYKGDVFDGSNRALKVSILEATLERGITNYDDFQVLLQAFGETRTRNSGTDQQYENVKPADAKKGVNLKEYVFSREFIELDAAGKDAALSVTMTAKYEATGNPRVTPPVMLNTLREWDEVRAREIKYLHTGSAFYKVYQNASIKEQRQILDEREARFYQPFGGRDGRGRDERDGARSASFERWREWRGVGGSNAGDRRRRGDPRTAERGRDRIGQGKESRLERRRPDAREQWATLEREHRGIIRRWTIGARNWGADRDYDAEFDRSRPPAESVDRVRSVPGRGLDGGAPGSEVLLPNTAHVHMENDGANRADALRRAGDRVGERGIDASGNVAQRDQEASREPNQPSGVAPGEGWRTVVDRMYEAYGQADRAERARLVATSAEKFKREKFGLKGGGKLPRDFDPDTAPGSLAQVKSLGNVASLQFDGPAGGQDSAARGQSIGPGQTGDRRVASTYAPSRSDYPYGFHDVQGPDYGAYDVYGEAPSATQAPRFMQAVATERSPDVLQPDAGIPVLKARPRSATGRAADSVRDQLARDLAEAKAARSQSGRSEFHEIKATLDATRLLAALSHSHGLIPSKYQVTKGRDGADRIQAGTRNLNVSDFLTKEMNLPWSEAANLMREQYRAQTGRDPANLPRGAPEQDLWNEFQMFRRSYADALRTEWTEQGKHEQARRIAIKSAFYAKRGRVADNMEMAPAQRKAAVSLARVERIEAEAVLRRQIVRERDALKAAMRRPLTEQYREFLQEQAQAGNAKALRELRRMQPTAGTSEDIGVTFGARTLRRGAVGSEPNEIIFSGPAITHQVQINGNVEYQRGGRALLVDEGRTVRMWDHDRDAIELGLRLAQQKFGTTLTLTGPAEFQAAAARVAADARMNVDFEDDALREVYQTRRAEIDAEADERRAADRERDAADQRREQARLDEQRAPERDPGAWDEHGSGQEGIDGADVPPEIDR